MLIKHRKKSHDLQVVFEQVNNFLSNDQNFICVAYIRKLSFLISVYVIIHLPGTKWKPLRPESHFNTATQALRNYTQLL